MKYQLMCIGNNCADKSFIFENAALENSKEVTILGVTIDNKLNFQSHIKTLCKKASQKLWALSRLSNYLNYTEKSLIFNSMVSSWQ